MKEKMQNALELLILNLEDELKYIEADAVDYSNATELLEYVKQNIFAQFEEELEK